MLEPNEHWILERIASFGEQRFWAQAGREWTYRDLDAQIRACIGCLNAAGVQPGSVTALLGDYSFWSVAMFLALHLRRAIVVPIATRVPEEANARMQVAQPHWVADFTEGGEGRLERQDRECSFHPLLGAIVERRHAGLILFSSGSTGSPKAMVHDLDALWNVHRGKRPKKTSIVVFLMFDHIGGLNTLFNAVAVGGLLLVPRGRGPEEVAELIQECRAKVLPASPTFLNLLLMAGVHRRYDLSSLRMITYGTERMPESLLARLKATFPKVKCLQTFGTSETGIGNTVSQSSGSTLMRIADPHLEWRIVQGELWLKSSTQILGYLNHPLDSFTSDGWFRTGDLVEEAGDGFFRIVGRSSEMINVGGEKVLPVEVESVVMEVDGVLDCLAAGEANAITGQAVTVKVVVRHGDEPAAVRSRIRQHCRNRLAAYKVPVKIHFVESTPVGERFKKTRKA